MLLYNIVEEIQENLALQLVNPIRWQEVLHPKEMLEAQVAAWIEKLSCMYVAL